MQISCILVYKAPGSRSMTDMYKVQISCAVVYKTVYNALKPRTVIDLLLMKCKSLVLFLQEYL